MAIIAPIKRPGIFSTPFARPFIEHNDTASISCCPDSHEHSKLEPRDELTDPRRIERGRVVDGSEAGKSLYAWLVTGSVGAVRQLTDRRGLRTCEAWVVQIRAVEYVDDVVLGVKQWQSGCSGTEAQFNVPVSRLYVR